MAVAVAIRHGDGNAVKRYLAVDPRSPRFEMSCPMKIY